MAAVHHWVGVAGYHHHEALAVVLLVYHHSVGVAGQQHQDHMMIGQE